MVISAFSPSYAPSQGKVNPLASTLTTNAAKAPAIWLLVTTT